MTQHIRTAMFDRRTGSVICSDLGDHGPIGDAASAVAELLRPNDVCWSSVFARLGGDGSHLDEVIVLGDARFSLVSVVERNPGLVFVAEGISENVGLFVKDSHRARDILSEGIESELG